MLTRAPVNCKKSGRSDLAGGGVVSPIGCVIVGRASREPKSKLATGRLNATTTSDGLRISIPVPPSGARDARAGEHVPQCVRLPPASAGDRQTLRRVSYQPPTRPTH